MNTHLADLEQFRLRLYQSLPHRADATMDLLDALSSSPSVRSVIELSLAPAFRRGHTSVADAIDALLRVGRLSPYDFPRRDLEAQLQRAVGPEVPAPCARDFWLFSLDSLALARPHARTLSDRSYVYQATAVPRGVPVTIGHAYSILMALPERGALDPPWTVPLSGRRIPTRRTATQVGVEQVWDLGADESLPWAGQLAVLVADSYYSHAGFLAPLAGEPNWVVVTRLRSNRVLYGPPPPRGPHQRGRPRRYGERFDLRDSRTWGPPDEQAAIQGRTRGGREHTVLLQTWHDRRLRSQADHAMHEHPVSVVRAESRDQTGKRLWRRPLWLVVSGARRHELSLADVYGAYLRRSDQEHSHRFWRQHLLLAAFQTPDTQHEENWVMLVLLTHVQLFAARWVARDWPRPWEPAKSVADATVASATRVQRDFGRLLKVIGTPARPPQRRGKAPGRCVGCSPGRRQRHAVVRKAPTPAYHARAPC
jgi:hypothetical protein